MSILQNTRKPVGLGGKLMVKRMNSGSHAKLAEWGLRQLSIAPDAHILDAGCGGGANVARLLQRAPQGHVTGLDYSEVSVAESREVNQETVAAGRCEIVQGDISRPPFRAGTFDLITAFETIYFWPDLEKTFRGVREILKTDGTFFICNESNGHDEAAVKYSRIIDGMKLYDAQQLTDLLQKAGFRNIQTHEEDIWLCVQAVNTAE